MSPPKKVPAEGVTYRGFLIQHAEGIQINHRRHRGINELLHGVSRKFKGYSSTDETGYVRNHDSLKETIGFIDSYLS